MDRLSWDAVAAREPNNMSLADRSCLQPSAFVIGGGLSGVVTAYDLARRGFHVVVLEAHSSVGTRASSVISGIVSPLVESRCDPRLELSHTAARQSRLGAIYDFCRGTWYWSSWRWRLMHYSITGRARTEFIRLKRRLWRPHGQDPEFERLVLDDAGSALVIRDPAAVVNEGTGSTVGLPTGSAEMPADRSVRVGQPTEEISRGDVSTAEQQRASRELQALSPPTTATSNRDVRGGAAAWMARRALPWRFEAQQLVTNPLFWIWAIAHIVDGTRNAVTAGRASFKKRFHGADREAEVSASNLQLEESFLRNSVADLIQLIETERLALRTGLQRDSDFLILLTSEAQAMALSRGNELIFSPDKLPRLDEAWQPVPETGTNNVGASQTTKEQCERLYPWLRWSQIPIWGGIKRSFTAALDPTALMEALEEICAEKYGVQFAYGTKVLGFETQKTWFENADYAPSAGSLCRFLMKPLEWWHKRSSRVMITAIHTSEGIIPLVPRAVVSTAPRSFDQPVADFGPADGERVPEPLDEQTSSGVSFELEYPAVVIAGGAWSSPLSLLLGILVPVFPEKKLMLELVLPKIALDSESDKPPGADTQWAPHASAGWREIGDDGESPTNDRVSSRTAKGHENGSNPPGNATPVTPLGRSRPGPCVAEQREAARMGCVADRLLCATFLGTGKLRVASRYSEVSGWRERVPRKVRHAFVERALQLFPLAFVSREDTAGFRLLIGLRARSADGKPLVGALPSVHNAFINVAGSCPPLASAFGRAHFLGDQILASVANGGLRPAPERLSRAVYQQYSELLSPVGRCYYSPFLSAIARKFVERVLDGLPGVDGLAAVLAVSHNPRSLEENGANSAAATMPAFHPAEAMGAQGVNKTTPQVDVGTMSKPVAQQIRDSPS